MKDFGWSKSKYVKSFKMVLDFKILLPSNKRTVVKCVRISLEFYFERNINGKALRTLNVMTQFLGPPRQLCHQKYLA